MEVKICKLSEIDDKTGKLFEIKDKKIAIFRIGEEAYALDGIFSGNNIAEGKLNGYKLTTPFENIEIDIRTGKFVLSPGNEIKTYPVKVKHEVIYLDI